MHVTIDIVVVLSCWSMIDIMTLPYFQLFEQLFNLHLKLVTQKHPFYNKSEFHDGNDTPLVRHLLEDNV